MWVRCDDFHEGDVDNFRVGNLARFGGSKRWGIDEKSWGELKSR